MRLSRIAVFFLILNLAACEKIAILFTPKKQPIQSTSSLALKAENYFWNTLHQGQYKNIPQADYLLMAAYLNNPNDPKLAAHIGFLHIWKITERQQESQGPLITNQAVLGRNYFADALALEPGNAIYEGFFGVSQLIAGKIFHNKREEVRGYFTLKRAIAKWPEFNYFTAGYSMSGLPAQSSYFQEGLEWQWLTLDRCAGEKINRNNPNYRPFMHRETTKGKQRVCWNSWIAPYNFEGFFMNMGDMLVKSGDWKTGILIYQNAKLAKNYLSWPYRDMLEKRILHAKENVDYFNQKTASAEKAIMLNSGHGCMACHQQSNSV